MRTAEIKRKTKETDITVRFSLDGSGKGTIHTGIPFFDHMLDSFTRHSRFDLDIQAIGDLEKGPHHTIEDIGIVLGQVFTHQGMPPASTTVLQPSHLLLFLLRSFGTS